MVKEGRDKTICRLWQRLPAVDRIVTTAELSIGAYQLKLKQHREGEGNESGGEEAK
jgi:hypothetical protein